MTEKKIVILVAWDNETEHSLSDADKQRLADNNIEIVYTGIGKINATRAITDLVVRNEYESNADLHIVNVGCAGSHTTSVRTLIKPTVFIQRDMDARQFSYERYQTPEEERWIIKSKDAISGWLGKSSLSGSFRNPLWAGNHRLYKQPSFDYVLASNGALYTQPVICATGDNANGYSETSDEVPAFDAVDMEAFAFAKVCHHYNTRFSCYKWITDKAAEDSTIDELIENNKLLPWTQIIDDILHLAIAYEKAEGMD